MFFSYNGVNVFYKRHLGLGTPVILMHGWGGSSSSFTGAFDYLCGINRDVITLDFPGFGSSDFPPSDWGIADYALCVEALVSSLKLRKAILVGHSFGGRVALCLSNRSWVEKIAIVDGAGLKPRLSIKKEIKKARYRRAKRLNKDLSSFGSIDYLALSQSMRPVFVRVVNAFLDDRLSEIQCPVLLIWGRRDKETPPYMARKMKRKIKDSTLIFLDGGHFAYAENYLKFNLILAEFVKGGKECLFG